MSRRGMQLATLVTCGLAVNAFANPPQMINYQGRLVDGGALVHSNGMEVTLTLWDAPTGGSNVYQEVDSVDVVDGLYSTALGDNQFDGGASGLLDALNTLGTNAWLGLKLGSGAELTPRERLLSAPFALKAKESASVDGPGMVPLGGMVAIMPHLAGSWQPPASGQIKDGFMLADGHIVTAKNVAGGCAFAEGTTLPDMVNRFARGETNSGSIGCQDSFMVSNANIAQVSLAVSEGSVDIDHDHPATNVIGGTHEHSYISPNGETAIDLGSQYPVGDLETTTTTGGGAHSHTVDLPPLSTTIQSVSAQTVTLGSPTPTAIDNRPAHMGVVWVIRVR